MGLFDKKYCDVCGDKIGLLGNRKLEDGNLCKNCAAKLSPWFSGRRHSTLEDIKSQLADREANQAKVAAFRPTKTFGEGSMKLFIDEAARNFTVCYESNLKNGNPDILPLSAITECFTENEEHRSELKTKDKEGKMVSYNPPRYEYSYDFNCTIKVNHPYIDDMDFQINGNSLKKEATGASLMFSRKMTEYNNLCNEIVNYLLNSEQNVPTYERVTSAVASANAAMAESTSFGVPNGPGEIYDANNTDTSFIAQPSGNAGSLGGEWECPACFGKNSGGKFCEYCGTPRP